MPSRISETENILKAENKKLYEMIECQLLIASIKKLEQEVEVLSDKIKFIDDSCKENKLKIEELKTSINDPESKLIEITGIFLSDMIKLDDFMKKTAEIEVEIEKLKSQVPTNMLQTSLTDSKTKLFQLNASVKQKYEEILSINQQISAAFKLKVLDLLKTQLNGVEKEKSELEKELNKNSTKLTFVSEELEELTCVKDISNSETANQLLSLQTAVTGYKDSLKDIEHQYKELQIFESKNLEENIKETEAKIVRSNDSLNRKREEKKFKAEEIEKLSEEIMNQEQNKRNIEDNLELRKIQSLAKTAGEDLDKLNTILHNFNQPELAINKKSNTDEREKLNSERLIICGQINESKDRIETAEKELNEPKYKKAKENYIDECINERVLKEAVGDLSKYCTVLESSLLQIHAQKMVQINRSIREYWNSIYKGNDIDYIMVKADVKKGTDKRRSYSYRVVQCKNDVKIDMPGRCSTGQKVLASLIIRMALADTFAANCGVFVLDEPTTNLDQKNIDALSEALITIIKEREENFMLLIITHNEDFLKQLRGPKQCFKVYRNLKGISRIDKLESGNEW